MSIDIRGRGKPFAFPSELLFGFNPCKTFQNCKDQNINTQFRVVVVE